MPKYFIFYTETKEVIALYESELVDHDRYIVSSGPQVEHALVLPGAEPHSCEIIETEDGGWIAQPK